MDFMELLWSLGLIVFLLVALNHMAGGRASNVLRPVSNIASGLVSFAVRLCMSALGGVVRLLGGSVKMPGPPKIRDDKIPPGRTPPRWDE
jgi:hypothetical protein